MKKKVFKVLFLISLSLMINCTNQDDGTPPSTDPESVIQDENFVRLDKAVSIASVMKYSNQGTTSKIKQISKTTAVSDKNGNPYYYVTNYKGGGFIIISADNRINPILAFSESGKYSTDLRNQSNGLINWMDEGKQYITNLRTTNAEQTNEVAQTWEECDAVAVISGPRPIGDCDDDENCQDEIFTKGPLLSTEWHQKQPLNSMLDPVENGCTPPVGCVAVAMGQLMKYHKYPNTYDWDAMPDNYFNLDFNNPDDLSAYFDPAAPTLMFDLGFATNMNYTCDESGTTEYEGTSSFTADFGYSSASSAAFNIFTVKSEIQQNRPVLLWGSGNHKTELETYGHTWVADGYRNIYNCDTGLTYLYLHMNWGWAGSQNGYFYYWNTTDYNFDSNKRMTYNIRP